MGAIPGTRRSGDASRGPEAERGATRRLARHAATLRYEALPPALAVAEKLGGVSGRDLITAVAAGTDVMTQLTQAIDVPDWTMTEGWWRDGNR